MPSGTKWRGLMSGRVNRARLTVSRDSPGRCKTLDQSERGMAGTQSLYSGHVQTCTDMY